MKKTLTTALIGAMFTCYAINSDAQANQSLSNLTAPTAVNQDLLPDFSKTRDLGNSGHTWNHLFFDGAAYSATNRVFSNDAVKANVFAGANAGIKNNYGTGNSAYGYVALFSNTNGYANTATGQYSMNKNVSGFSNTAYGSESLRGNVFGYFNTAVGQASLAGSVSYDNTAVGRYALISLTTGNSNTALGSAANLSDGTLSNVTLLGFYTTATASNSVQIGNSAVTSVKAANNIVIVSDGRYKKNIKENVPGLKFINALNPVTYNYDMKGLDKLKGIGMQHKNANEKVASDVALKQYAEALDKKEKISYSGFVAQEVEKAAQKLGYDFSGVYKPQNDQDAYGLSYAEFVVPLVKAVQELSKMNDDKEEMIKDLNTRLEKLEAMMNAPQSDISSRFSKTLSATGASLEQNIPNPFNQNTVIKYYVPQNTGTAVINITDKNGNIIKTIPATVKGKGQVVLQAGQFAAGTYQYSLLVDGKLIDTKKMVLIK